jgi:hypothetical protein
MSSVSASVYESLLDVACYAMDRGLLLTIGNDYLLIGTPPTSAKTLHVIMDSPSLRNGVKIE